MPLSSTASVGSSVTLIFYKVGERWWKEPTLNLIAALAQQSPFTHAEIAIGENAGGSGQMTNVLRIFNGVCLRSLPTDIQPPHNASRASHHLQTPLAWSSPKGPDEILCTYTCRSAARKQPNSACWHGQISKSASHSATLEWPARLSCLATPTKPRGKQICRPFSLPLQIIFSFLRRFCAELVAACLRVGGLMYEATPSTHRSFAPTKI